MYTEIRNNLSTKIDQSLVDDLLDDYIEIKKHHFLGDHEKAINKSGKFVETIFQILEYILSKKIINEPNFNSISKKLEQIPKGDLPESIRIIIPRSANVIYSIRSRRGTAHKSEVSPNYIDSEVVVSICDWILSEFLRIYHNSNIAEITNIVNKLVDKKIPIIEEFDNGLVILREGLSIKDQILIVLYYFYPNPVTTEELIKLLKCKYSQQITSNLRTAEGKKLIHRDGKENTITKLGIKLVEEIVNKSEI